MNSNIYPITGKAGIMKKYYKYMGSGGIPGLPHIIEKSKGDQWIKEFEDLNEMITREIDRFGLHNHQGNQLKCALARGSYKLIKPKGSSGKGKPPDDQKGLSDKNVKESDKEK